MFVDTYRTLAAPAEGIYKEKGSKFLSFAYPVHDAEEIRLRLDAIRKDYFDARHHCYAYILGYRKDVWRANDDGEPSGTGGRPIYGQLLSADLTDTLIVVVRYFGGVLLGASGLANAYKTAAHDAIMNGKIVEKTMDVQYLLTFEYPTLSNVMRILKDFGVKPLRQQFDIQCSMIVGIRQSQASPLCDALNNLRCVKIDQV